MLDFLTAEECEGTFLRRGFTRHGIVAGSRAATRFKAYRYCYDNPRSIAREIAQAVVSEFGASKNCILWDYGSAMGSPHQADRVRYRAWRLAGGERPGRRFEGDDVEPLTMAIELMLLTYRDALLGKVQEGPILRFCDGDLIEIFSRTQPRSLLSRLLSIGLTALPQDASAKG